MCEEPWPARSVQRQHRQAQCGEPFLLGLLRETGGCAADYRQPDLKRRRSVSGVRQPRAITLARCLAPPAPSHGIQTIRTLGTGTKLRTSLTSATGCFALWLSASLSCRSLFCCLSAFSKSRRATLFPAKGALTPGQGSGERGEGIPLKQLRALKEPLQGCSLEELYCSHGIVYCCPRPGPREGLRWTNFNSRRMSEPDPVQLAPTHPQSAS